MLIWCNFTQKRFKSLAETLRRMGRRNRGVNKFAQRKRDRKEQESNPTATPTGDTRKPYEEIVRENAAFEEYYKSQKICPEDEWDQFMASLKENLPTAFRITGSRSEAAELLRIVKSEYFSELLSEHVKSEGSEEEIKPICLPWYPGGLAWQLRLSRSDIRRNETLYKLHNFLTAETAAGGVSRQEAVSMIPPVVLQVRPHHKVLDMCAAPGSKTAQLIEFLHADEDKMPSGLVVANDVDNSRCYMLVHQAKRLNSPCVLICNHDAALLPAMDAADPRAPGGSAPLRFDRVLCDVPCSGDGTLRKNPDIWPKWSVGNGNNLHGVQFRIARRGCELLAPGGRLVYSTCSLNPVENEAVVLRVLRAAAGAVRLVDAAHLLPGLRYREGVTHWRPASRDMVLYDAAEDVPERWRTAVHAQMFPPAPAELPLYQLHKCIRILPHHQDTGGFFVAVFEKTDLMPWEKRTADSGPEREGEAPEERREPPSKRRRPGGYTEDPFVFFSGAEEDVFPSIRRYYELSPEFDAGLLLTRCRVGKKKNVYLVSPAVRELLRRNERRLKVINTGVKTFVRCDNKKMSCAFRLSQEGLASVLPWLGAARRVAVAREDAVRVLQCDTPAAPPALEEFSQGTQERVRDLEVGSCVLELAADGARLRLVGWRGARSLRAYTARADTVHCLRLLGADCAKFDVNKFKKDPADEPEGPPAAAPPPSPPAAAPLPASSPPAAAPPPPAPPAGGAPGPGPADDGT